MSVRSHVYIQAKLFASHVHFIFSSKLFQLNSCWFFVCWVCFWFAATEVNVARSRLKGALQEIEGNQNDDDDLDSSKPSRGRPPKRVKKELSPPPQQTVHHTFIMKLFDRSVDLGKYTPETALYPICRAWMFNQPRSNLIVKYGNILEYFLRNFFASDSFLFNLQHVIVSLTVTKRKRNRRLLSANQMMNCWTILTRNESARWLNYHPAKMWTFHGYHRRCHFKRIATSLPIWIM